MHVNAAHVSNPIGLVVIRRQRRREWKRQSKMGANVGQIAALQVSGQHGTAKRKFGAGVNDKSRSFQAI
jgi:hypothetical protein